MKAIDFSQDSFSTALPLSLQMALDDVDIEKEDHLLDEHGRIDENATLAPLLDLEDLIPSVADMVEALGIPGRPVHNARQHDESFLYATGIIDWHTDNEKMSHDTRVMIFHPPCEGFRLQVAHATADDYDCPEDLEKAMQNAEDRGHFLAIDMPITSGSVATIDLKHYVRIIFDGDARILKDLSPILFFDVSYSTSEASVSPFIGEHSCTSILDNLDEILWGTKAQRDGRMLSLVVDNTHRDSH